MYSPETTPAITSSSSDTLASPTSLQWQAVAQEMLLSPRLVEVEENVFSTCQDPLEKLEERLMRACDTNTPLVEICIASAKDYANANQLREMLGIEGTVATTLQMATGKEGLGYLEGKKIAFRGLKYVTRQEGGRITYGEELTTVMNYMTYSRYANDRRDAFGRLTGSSSFHISSEYESGFRPWRDISPEARKFLIETIDAFRVASL